MFDIIYCGKDLDYQLKVFSNLPFTRYKITSIRSTKALAGYLSTHTADLVII